MDNTTFISDQDINSRAEELAKKLYQDNKEIIDEITDDKKDVLPQNECDNAPYKEVKKKKKKWLWILLGIAAMALILLLIISNILNVGERLLKTNKYLGIGFYVLVILLILILIIIPSIEIMFLPSYNSLFAIENNGDKEKVVANVKKICLIAKKHQEQWNINKNEKTREKYNNALNTLKNSKDISQLVMAYRYIYKTYIKKDVLNIITSYSNKIFLATAVVQNGKVDSFIMFSSYFKMSKDILKYCGFRISFVRLCKLAINILIMLAAATKLGEVDLSSIFPKVLMNYLEKIPGARVVVSSLSDGVADALMFYKTGVMLEEYLLSDNQNIIHQWAVSIKETAKYMLTGLIVSVIKKVIEFTTVTFKKTVQGIKKFFTTFQEQITNKKNKTPALIE